MLMNLFPFLPHAACHAYLIDKNYSVDPKGYTKRQPMPRNLITPERMNQPSGFHSIVCFAFRLPPSLL